MAAKVAKPDRQKQELDNLWHNRRYRFRDILGDDWPNDDIEVLAKKIEVHPTDLEKLIKNGCPPRTAVKILI